MTPDRNARAGGDIERDITRIIYDETTHPGGEEDEFMPRFDEAEANQIGGYAWSMAAARKVMARLAPAAWLPIATAPRDGTPLLAWDGEEQVVAFWHAYMVGGRDRGAWYMANGFNNEWQPCPTHWQPLPAPPLPAPPEVTPAPDGWNTLENRR